MKRTIGILTTVFLLTLIGCQQNPLPLDPPPSKIEGIVDTWVLVSVKQVDENSTELDPTIEVGTLFNIGGETTMIFNEDGTYSYTQASGFDYIGASGTWSFDDDIYPTLINMDNGIEMYTLPLLGPTRPQDTELKFEIGRFCNGVNGVSYRYTFNRL